MLRTILLLSVSALVILGMCMPAGADFIRGTGALEIIDDDAGAHYVDVTGNVLVGTPGSFLNTVAGWYKYRGTDLDTRNFVWETSAPDDWPLSFNIRNDTTTDGLKHAEWYTDSPSTGADENSLPMVDDGQWHHAAIVIDEAADTLKYYHDGILTDDVSIPGLALDWANLTGFHIGNHRSGDGSRNWDGWIDDMAVFASTLTGPQIADLYSGAKMPDTLTGVNLTAYWTFDSDFSSTVNNGLYQGTAVGAAVITPIPEPGTVVLLITGALGLAFFAWRKR